MGGSGLSDDTGWRMTDDEESNNKLGRFELDRLLGKGGMGEVWRAFDPLTERTVAIKRMHSDALDNRRLTQEMRILARLDHPHIVRLYDALEIDGELYLVMEYIEGHTLAELMERRVDLSEQQCLEWFRQLAGALAYAHGNALLHRDIKPGNVIIDAASAKARLLDFGIALSLDATSRLTRSDFVPQTPEFAAPEQEYGATMDARSDIYSLGLTLASTWMGSVPARESGGGHPVMLPATASSRAAAIFARCLARTPEDRFPSADALQQALEQHHRGRTPKRAALSERGRRLLQGAGSVAALGFALYLLYAVLSRPAEFVSIPGGSFRSGMDPSDYQLLAEDVREILLGMEQEPLRRKVLLKPFRIGRYEVTNEQYAEFIGATGRTAPTHWQGQEPPTELRRHPVVNVDYDDASAYAAWRGLRLPTADEWERAARGNGDRLYPWGMTFDAARTNTEESGQEGTTVVAQYAGDVSPFDVIGMGGNVTEWTSTPMVAADGEAGFVVSGGSWLEIGRDRFAGRISPARQPADAIQRCGFSGGGITRCRAPIRKRRGA